MPLSRIDQAREIIRQQPSLIWYTNNYDGLDEAAIAEAVFNYGNWPDFLRLKKIFGLKHLKSAFDRLTGGRRVNLRPQAVNFFKLYFARHVPANSL